MTLSAPTVTPAHARRFHDEGWFVIERRSPDRARDPAQRVPAPRRRARRGDDPPRRRHARPLPPRPPLLPPRLRHQPSGAAVPVLRPHGRHRPSGARRDTSTCSTSSTSSRPPSGACRSAGTRTPASSPTRTRRTSPAGSRSTTSAKPTAPSTCCPTPRAGTRDVVAHHRDHETNDLIGYSGDDPGDPLIVPAGSIAAFSSTLLHRTGPNTTDQPRRVYIAQYTAEPLLNEDRSRPRHLAEPLLVAGQRPTHSESQEAG